MNNTIKSGETGTAAVGQFLLILWHLAFITLIVWWAFATFFPELGMTYWGLVLPVYAFRLLVAARVEVGK